MAAAAMNAPLANLTLRLESVGFRKRAGMVFTKDVGEDVIGWLGLNKASRHLGVGQVEVNPVVGIRHQGVERVVAELREEKFHAYQPPTVSTPLDYLMPGSRYRSWLLGARDAETIADELVASVVALGLPFIESGAALSVVCRLLDQGLGFDHQLVYRRPVAWALAGDVAYSLKLVGTAEAELGDRSDAAAAELRSFVAAFRSRFGVSSSD